jgi:hypothetical protein
MNWTPLNITVRVGCSLVYETTVPTPVLFVLRPRLEGKVLVTQEKLSFGIGRPSYEFQDTHGNITYRSMFMPGRNEIRHDALVAVSSLPDSRDVMGQIQPVGQLPCEVLRYTLPSRYCDSDKLMDFAWKQFGQVEHGLPRVPPYAAWPECIACTICSTSLLGTALLSCDCNRTAPGDDAAGTATNYRWPAGYKRPSHRTVSQHRHRRTEPRTRPMRRYSLFL